MAAKRKKPLTGLKAKAESFMERTGYAVLGFAAVLGTPAFLYMVYFTGPSAPGDLVEARGRVASLRVVETRTTKDNPRVYLELQVEGLAVPLQFHPPHFDPEDPAAPLKAPALAAPAGLEAAAHVARSDEASLRKAPFYAPHRWVQAYSLEIGGKTYLSLEDGLKATRATGRMFLYMANGFVALIGGLILFVLVFGLETYRLGAGLRSKGLPTELPGTEGPAAESASSFYYILIPLLLFLNLPALASPKVWAWNFDGRFWLVFAAAAAALQALFYFHHRRYLSIIDSKPRLYGDPPGGFFAYLVLTLLLLLMLTPILQFARVMVD
ncbi:MAG: hypothetical protein HY550_00870 [Elusimicrobia bacterium]|nr:hypothetical protein [Elusimicrobiota bacterium]